MLISEVGFCLSPGAKLNVFHYVKRSLTLNAEINN